MIGVCVCVSGGQRQCSEDRKKKSPEHKLSGPLGPGTEQQPCLCPSLVSVVQAAVSASHCSAHSSFRPPLPSPLQTTQAFQRKPLLILAESLDNPTHRCPAPWGSVPGAAIGTLFLAGSGGLALKQGDVGLSPAQTPTV